MNHLLASILVALALAACSKSTPPPATPAPRPISSSAIIAQATPPFHLDTEAATPANRISDADLDKLMRDVVTFMGAIADEVGKAGGDCTQVAAAIERVTAANAELIVRTRALDDDDGAQGRADKWMEAHVDEIKPVFERLLVALQPCEQDEGVRRSVERIEGSQGS